MCLDPNNRSNGSVPDTDATNVSVPASVASSKTRKRRKNRNKNKKNRSIAAATAVKPTPTTASDSEVSKNSKTASTTTGSAKTTRSLMSSALAAVLVTLVAFSSFNHFGPQQIDACTWKAYQVGEASPFPQAARSVAMRFWESEFAPCQPVVEEPVVSFWDAFKASAVAIVEEPLDVIQVAQNAWTKLSSSASVWFLQAATLDATALASNATAAVKVHVHALSATFSKIMHVDSPLDKVQSFARVQYKSLFSQNATLDAAVFASNATAAIKVHVHALSDTFSKIFYADSPLDMAQSLAQVKYESFFSQNAVVVQSDIVTKASLAGAFFKWIASETSAAALASRSQFSSSDVARTLRSLDERAEHLRFSTQVSALEFKSKATTLFHSSAAVVSGIHRSVSSRAGNFRFDTQEWVTAAVADSLHSVSTRVGAGRFTLATDTVSDTATMVDSAATAADTPAAASAEVSRFTVATDVSDDTATMVNCSTATAVDTPADTPAAPAAAAARVETPAVRESPSSLLFQAEDDAMQPGVPPPTAVKVHVEAFLADRPILALVIVVMLFVLFAVVFVAALLFIAPYSRRKLGALSDEIFRQIDIRMGANNPNCYYNVLGVRINNATASQIKKGYHAMAKQTHSDKTGDDYDAAAFHRVQEAYDALSDADSRLEYDLRQGYRI